MPDGTAGGTVGRAARGTGRAALAALDLAAGAGALGVRGGVRGGALAAGAVAKIGLPVGQTAAVYRLLLGPDGPLGPGGPLDPRRPLRPDGPLGPAGPLGSRGRALRVAAWAAASRPWQGLLPALVDAVLDRIDLTDLVLRRVDLIALAQYVVDGIDLPLIIRESTGSVASEGLRGVRLQSLEADQALAGVVDRALLRRRPRRTGAEPEPAVESEVDTLEP